MGDEEMVSYETNAKYAQESRSIDKENGKRKINCWEFVKCGRDFEGEKVAEKGICPVVIDTSADGSNEGKNGGRICWDIVGTFCGGKISGRFAKKLLSCRSCNFFKTVKKETGIEHFILTKQKNTISNRFSKR